MNPVIEVASLRKAFRGRDGTPHAVLKDLDLTVGAGEFLCVLGAVRLRQIDLAQRARRAGQGLRGAGERERRPRRLPVPGAAPAAHG